LNNLRDVVTLTCGGRKSPSPFDLTHGLYNSVYYCISRDKLAHVFHAYNL